MPIDVVESGLRIVLDDEEDEQERGQDGSERSDVVDPNLHGRDHGQDDGDRPPGRKDDQVPARLAHGLEGLHHTCAELRPGLVVFVIEPAAVPASHGMGKELVEGLPRRRMLRQEARQRGLVGELRTMHLDHVFMIELGQSGRIEGNDVATQPRRELLETLSMSAHGTTQHRTGLEAARPPPLAQQAALARAKLGQLVIVVTAERGLTMANQIEIGHYRGDFRMRSRQRCSR